MTYYPATCSYCGRIVCMYTDEAYAQSPRYLFCDGCCWNHKPHYCGPNGPVKP